MAFRVILFCLSLLTSTGYAQELRSGTLKSVTGDVSLTQAGVLRHAETGGGLFQADHIETGRNASITMTFKDGTLVTVGPNSKLELATLKFDTTAQEGNLLLNLAQGTIRVVTGWLGKLHPQQVKVVTPTSVVGVRGTDFIVEVP